MTPDPFVERFRLLADIVQELARIAGVQPAESLYTTLERLREVQNQETERDK